jgi:predicted regulator of amino acid metabolism with ACT domain
MRAVLRFLESTKRGTWREELEALYRAGRRVRDEIAEACGKMESPDKCIAKAEEGVKILEELRRRVDCNDVECADAREAIDEAIQTLRQYIQLVEFYAALGLLGRPKRRRSGGGRPQ